MSLLLLTNVFITNRVQLMFNVTFIHGTVDAEKMIVDMARVSNPDNQGNYESGPRLLRYLIKHEHWSPFEMASMCLCICTQRDISAQILRHRSFSFQEFSTRYGKTTMAEIPAMRRQDTKNRQNSFDDFTKEEQGKFEYDIANVVVHAYRVYNDLLDAGVAKETARRVLPLCTDTTLYMHGTLRSWIHYIQLRTKPDTQLEHRRIAQRCLELFAQKFPVVAEAAFPDLVREAG